jgi:angio-associated migratory cell protein
MNSESNQVNEVEGDDIYDEPEYLDSNDVIEVATLDETTDDIPMDDDDDGDDDDDDEDGIADDADDNTDSNMEDNAAPPSPELFMNITSHSGPVYSCATMVLPSTDNNNDTSLTTLLIASGGGDDIACWTRINLRYDDINSTFMAEPMVTNNDAESYDKSSIAQKLAYHHSDSVSAVAFGKLSTPTTTTTTTAPHQISTLLLAVGAYDGTILLYDGITGSCLMNIINPDEYKNNFVGPSDVEWLTFHKTGTVLLAGSSTDGTVWMYHIVQPTTKQPYYTLNCMQVFVGHATMVSAGGFTSDGRWAVSIGNSGTRDDATVRIWNPKTGIAKHSIHLHSGSTSGIIASSSTFDNDKTMDEDVGFAGLTCLAFGTSDESTSQSNNSSGKLLLMGSEDGWAYVCHCGTGKVLNTFRHAVDPSHSHQPQDAGMEVDADNETHVQAEFLLSIEAVGFCPSNPMWCATGGADGVLKIWDLNNGQCRHSCRVPVVSNNNLSETASKNTATNGGITRLCWLPPVGATSGTETNTAISPMQLPPPIVFVATTDGMVHLWDARNGGLLHSLQTGGRATINDLQVLTLPKDHVIVITASEDHAVRLFQIYLMELLQKPKK